MGYRCLLFDVTVIRISGDVPMIWQAIVTDIDNQVPFLKQQSSICSIFCTQTTILPILGTEDTGRISRL